MGFIYMLTFPSEKSYIGQTIRDIEERLKEHQYASSGCVAVYNAIQKYGWEKVKKDWYEVPDEDLNKHEELMVEVLGTLSPGGYNLKEGGGASGKPSEETKQKIREAKTGTTHTEETKKKMSEAQTGRILSDEHRKKLGEAQTGKTHTEETKKKLMEAQTGKTHTKETKKKMSEAQTGRILSDEHRKKLGEAQTGKTHTKESKKKMSEAKYGEKNTTAKKVYQYNLDGTYVNAFGSSGEAAHSLNKIDGSSIRSCARGKQPSAYGFKWTREKL